MINLISLLVSLLVSSSGINEPSCEVYFSQDMTETIITAPEDKNLGPVNLCDPDGKVCLEGVAYLDGENGRIYVTNVSPNRTSKYYSQKSNDKRWPWMVRISKEWYYFDF